MSAAGSIRFDLDGMEDGLSWMRELNTATARGLSELRRDGDPGYFADAIDILESDASDYFGTKEDVTVAEYLSSNPGNLLEQYRIFQEAIEREEEVCQDVIDTAEGLYRALTDIEMQDAYGRFSDLAD